MVVATQLACVPRIMERCRLVTHPTPPPALPAGFAELDALLLRRATDMTLASRDLNSSLAIVFRRDFAEVLLPALCERLERARTLAMAGRTAEAGKTYQALLVSSQVLAFAVAIQSMAQYADRRLHAGGQVSLTQEKFAAEAAPILEAALSEDPRDIERALTAHPEVFARWAALLDGWPARIDDGAHQARVAMVVLDIAFLVVATYQAAGAAAEMVAAGRPPMPPLPTFAAAGGVATANYAGPATLELAEALRKLIASGALDASVVAALSALGGGAAPSPPTLPSTNQMSGGRAAPKPWRIDRYDKVVKWGERKIYRDPDTGLWWSKDTAGHGGSVWKVFEEERTGLRWLSDADELGNFIVSKHKGPVGKLIPWTELSGG